MRKILRKLFPWLFKKRKPIKFKLSNHALKRYRTRFAVQPGTSNSELKEFVKRYVTYLYLKGLFEKETMKWKEDRYYYKDETWVLSISETDTYIKIEVITCWKD